MTDTRTTPVGVTHPSPAAVRLRQRDSLFSLPLPVPTDTLYRELGLDPEASDEEVRWAKSHAVQRLQRRQSSLEQELDVIYGGVPGLREGYQKLERLEREEY